MEYLADSHTLLWYLEGSYKLSNLARSLFGNPSNRIIVSIASLWEIAIKYSLQKLKLTDNFDLLFPAELIKYDISILQIGYSHLNRLAILPFHHRDPFDRMLIAQAIEEDLPIVSSDVHFDSYDVSRIW